MSEREISLVKEGFTAILPQLLKKTGADCQKNALTTSDCIALNRETTPRLSYIRYTVHFSYHPDQLESQINSYQFYQNHK